MEQSASWEANRSSANQEIPPVLWNPNVYRIQNARHQSVPKQDKSTPWLSNLFLEY
jgi:hypothetical protein